MDNISVDLDRWPLVVYTFDGQPQEQDVDFFIKAVDQIHARGETYASIGHVKKAKVDTSLVKRAAHGMIKNWPFAKQYCCGSAIVISSPVFRFLLSSFFLITPIPYPYIVTENLDEAIEWTTKQLTNAGQRVPPPKQR